MRLLLGAVLTLALVASAASAAPSTWTITGTVTSHTGPPRPVAGQEVKLTAYVNGAEQDWQTASTDAQGAFTFTVPADAQRTYAVQVKYRGGEYDSAAIAFKPGETTTQIAMRVYEPTSDPAVLRVNVHHIIVEAGEGAVQVAELLVFTNASDRTYIGGPPRADGKRETIRFTLPAGAVNVQYMEGLMECCVSATDTGMVDTMDVEPGMREIAYAYTLPAGRGALALTRPLDYSAERVEVFGNATVRLEVAPLPRQQDVTTDQGTYARFSGTDLRAGTEIQLSLSGLPVPRSATRRLAMALFAGVVAAALVYPLLRRRASAPAQTEPTQTREDLIAAVAALDDRFEAGQIPDAEYRRRREWYLTRLRRLMNLQEIQAGTLPGDPASKPAR